VTLHKDVLLAIHRAGWRVARCGVRGVLSLPASVCVKKIKAETDTT